MTATKARPKTEKTAAIKPSPMDDLCRQCERARILKGLTHNQLGDHCGVGGATIYAFIKGHGGLKPPMFDALITALGLDLKKAKEALMESQFEKIRRKYGQ